MSQNIFYGDIYMKILKPFSRFLIQE